LQPGAFYVAQEASPFKRS